jgi:hemerythrin-like domain-containing protein
MSAARTRTSRKPLLPLSTLQEFEALDRTHSEVLQHLRELDRLVQRMETEPESPANRMAARAACVFFTSAARQHHADEERIVFPPLLASRDADLVQNVERLQQDHGWLEEDWLEIEPLLETVASGAGAVDPVQLRDYLSVFGALYLEHISLEESLIYPEAKRRFAAQADSDVQRGTGTAST